VIEVAEVFSLVQAARAEAGAHAESVNACPHTAAAGVSLIGAGGCAKTISTV
jgi:hypothetical protein